MQIFVTDANPAIAAARLWQNPKRAIKMITESCQIIACGQQHFGLTLVTKKDGSPFATLQSRMNHPVIQWAREDKRHLGWVVRHLFALSSHYQGQGFQWLPQNLSLLKQQGLDQLAPPDYYCNFAKADAKQLDFRHMSNVFVAYDAFLKAQNS